MTPNLIDLLDAVRKLTLVDLADLGDAVRHHSPHGMLRDQGTLVRDAMLILHRVERAVAAADAKMRLTEALGVPEPRISPAVRKAREGLVAASSPPPPETRIGPTAFGPIPLRATDGGADKYSPPTIDDVKHLVGLALPAIVRIHQLRRLLGMGVEPFSDMTAIGEPDGIGRARRAIREWVYRAAPFTSPQLQDMLDTIAECLGEQKKD